MTTTDEALLEASIEVGAPVARVWEVVSDVCRMPEWSPQVKSSRLRRGFDEVALGAQFTNLNGHGELEWITHAEIVRFTAEREVAFRIEENRVIWSFQLEPAGAARTRLTQRRTAPDGISELSLNFVDTHLGGQQTFTTAMRAGMSQTLERIKADAEA